METTDGGEESLFTMPEIESKSDPFIKYTDNIRKDRVPLIIDNGSYLCKAGWACKDTPLLIFRNHVAKLRGKKENEADVGNSIQNIEAVRWLLKTQFDRNVITQFDIQETVFDYIFTHLGISTEGCVDHPVVLTEAVCNPNHSRQLMNELLFECYQVPSVAYGVDSLFAFYFNRRKHNAVNGLILSLGHNTTHVIPYLSEKVDLQNCCRINVGGQHMTTNLHRLLQLKYPPHASSITLSRVEALMHQHTYFSKNYCEELRKWEEEDYYQSEVRKIQLPFTPPLASSTTTSAGKLEKCNGILRQVQAMKIKRRAEKLAYEEERLQELLSVQELLEDDDDEAILALQELGYSTGSELQAGIKELNCKIEKIKSTIANQHVDELQDSPLKGWCDELDLSLFSDAELWIEAIRNKKQELKENPVQTNFGIKSSTDLSGFSFSRALDMIGGLHELCGTDQSYKDYISRKEEHREHLEVLSDIIAEYDVEFSNLEQGYACNTADFYQLHLGVERIRMPEIIFQPNLLGIEQAGLAESVEMVLSRYSPNIQQKLVENVFVSGGCATIPYARERIEAELMAIRPFQSKFHVSLSEDPVLDAWKGARTWSASRNNLSKHSISKADYHEKGSDYLKGHGLSNIYYPTPQSSRKTSLLGEGSVTSKNES